MLGGVASAMKAAPVMPKPVTPPPVAAFDWQPFLTGGATRADAMTGLNPNFNSALKDMFQAAPPHIQKELRVMSAYRSPEIQKALYENALKKYGSEAAARKWVAPPGRSQHNHGMAADLTFLSDDAKKWVHANAEKHGMHFPMSWEPWHIELAGSRDGTALAQAGSVRAKVQGKVAGEQQRVAGILGNDANSPTPSLLDQLESPKTRREELLEMLAEMGKGMEEEQQPQQAAQVVAQPTEANDFKREGDPLENYMQLFEILRTSV
jgi:hypothetical protein